MADVLLTHSYHLPFDPKQVRKMQPYAPLGTLYAASALRAGNISVAVFDTMLEDPEPGFINALSQSRPRIVAIYEDDFNFLSKMCLTRMRELASPDIHTLISPASSTLMAQAVSFKVQTGRRRTHPGAPFPNPPVSSSTLNHTVKPGPLRTVNSPQMLSPAADARIDATGAPSQSRGISFRFALPGPSQGRFVN
jgi:hypothetical protein